MDEVVLQMIDSFMAQADTAQDSSFETFRSAWRKTNLPLLFEIRLDQEPLDQFLERIFCHCLDLLLNLNPYEKRVLLSWLIFALYSIFMEQPAKPRHRIPLSWNDWSCYLSLLKFASQSADLYDAWFALYQLHNENALKYCVARRCPPVAPPYQLAPPYQYSGTAEPLHRLIDVGNLRRHLEEYDQEAAGFMGNLQLKTAQIFDSLEELESILLLRPTQQTCISNALPDSNALPEESGIFTEANLELFNADQPDNESPVFLSYRRDDDQSSTDYDEADASF